MKLTMMEFSRIAATLLALPRKNRDQLELLLIEKRAQENQEKGKKAPVQP
jgi:hypothetical protein